VYLFKETDDEDIRLVKECLDGKGKSYEILVEKYYKVIFRLSGKFVKNYDDAEDITQAVFVKAYENLKSYDKKFKFFSWLYRITVNESINFGKRRKNTEGLTEELRSEDDNPGVLAENNDVSSNVQDALMKIDIIYRIPLVLKHFEGYSYKELSKILEIPEKTVKSRLFTGRQLLKDLLKHKV
jgi:RNA polymerase sigma-70 factor, ECF subfamily